MDSREDKPARLPARSQDWLPHIVSVVFGWATLLAIAYLVERPLLILSARWIDASWIATVHLMFDCVVMAAAGWVAGRFSRAGIFVFAGTLAFWDFGPLLAVNVPWMVRLLVEVFRDSRYLDSLVTTGVTQALLFASLFLGSIIRGNRHKGDPMSYRFLALAIMIVAPLPGQAPKKSWTVPRTADGHPDLQGVWTNATITPMDRPSAFAAKPTLSDTEAGAYEKHQLDELNKQDGQSDGPLIAAAGSSGTGGYNVLFVDRGSELARVDGVKRTSLVVDPPDGRAPPMTDEARKRNSGAMRNFNKMDSIHDRPMSERCLIGFGSTSGPPMMPVLYNNNYQIVQTPDAIMILVEMVHDVRIIRMNGTHPPPTVRQWLGDSIGHWEGDTLVVDTTNFTDKTRFRGTAEDLHVIERFRRADANTILYRATIDDPTTYTKQWTMEFPFIATKGPVYEYACHEGNYAMPDILGGARRKEAEATKKQD